MGRFVLFLLLNRILCAQDAGMEGITINAITRQPLHGVHVTMYSLPPGNALPEEQYGAISRKDGHFSIASMQPAVYGLLAQHNGFFFLKKADDRERTVKLAAGEHRTGFTIEMMPEAVITGRVLDSYGDPVQNASVQAVPAVHNPDSFVVSNMHGATDERGEFRIVSAPGKFYVNATVPQGILPHEIRTDGSVAPVYGATWHPASASKDQAVSVEALAGRETAGIDIHLVRKHNLTISGTVTGTPEGVARAAVLLNAKFLGVQHVTPDAEGKFVFSGLSQGRYLLAAKYDAVVAPLISQTVEVDLDTADNHDINLKLVPGEEVSGVLELEGASREKRIVGLEPLTPIGDFDIKSGEVDREGAFRIASVYPGKFRLHIDPLPENAFIKSVQVNGETSTNDVIDLSGGVAGARLKIAVDLNGGLVEGTVSVEAGDKPSGRGARIVLADKMIAAAGDMEDQKAMSVPAGQKYRFTGLRPGKYRLMVLDWHQPPEAEDLRAMFSRAPEIEVREGDRITRDVKLAPKEKLRANP